MSKQEISQEMLREIWIECEEEIVEMLQKKMENKLEKEEEKTFEVEVPNLKGKYYLDEDGALIIITTSDTAGWRDTYLRGLIFDTEEEAEQYDKERLLLFKIKKWAEIHNEGWKPDAIEAKYYICYDNDEDELLIDCTFYYNCFLKLPYFKTEEIAQACIDEFGDEILEVLC